MFENDFMITEVNTQQSAIVAGNLRIVFYMSKWFINLLSHDGKVYEESKEESDREDYLCEPDNYIQVGALELVNKHISYPSVGDTHYMPSDDDLSFEVNNYSTYMRRHIDSMDFNKDGKFEFGGNVSFQVGLSAYAHFVSFTGISAKLFIKQEDEQ
jgi:hypothetical protein